MILPNKYVEPSQSLFYLGAKLLKLIDNRKCNIVDLWINLKKDDKITYKKYLQIIVYLYTTGIISYTEEGEIYNENIIS